jgi:hypothetical protein
MLEGVGGGADRLPLLRGADVRGSRSGIGAANTSSPYGAETDGPQGTKEAGGESHATGPGSPPQGCGSTRVSAVIRP